MMGRLQRNAGFVAKIEPKHRGRSLHGGSHEACMQVVCLDSSEVLEV
jgi:hypothetical protein